MTVGFIILCHTALHRTAQIARHWAEHGAPVVIHVDHRVSDADYGQLTAAVADLGNVSFCKRFKCDWGTWSLVAASQAGAEQMLARHPEVRHVYLASGACLPLRPLQELVDYLDARPNTDFIESVTTTDVGWSMGGVDMERFTLRFPFSWKSQRKAFDRYVALQRRLGFKRTIPEGLDPHLGSQWWCLTRRTLSAILQDPRRKLYERYFKKVWIPDEAYFQTLVRRYSGALESRSLTLSKFDFQGKPHIFYDDHLELLRRSDCFVARKVWPKADRLYDTFLAPNRMAASLAEPNPSKVDRLFAQAVERRTKGRAGLYMQSRYPLRGRENGKTSAPYSIFQGFTELFDDFDNWLGRQVGARVHGHIFGPERAEFAGAETVFNGCLSDSATLRDYDPQSFLASLIWNSRGERQCFMFGPRDTQSLNAFTAADPNAQISVVTGAWAVPLFRSNLTFAEIRHEAARLQQIEFDQVEILKSVLAKARIRVWSMSEFLEHPMENLQAIVDEIAPRNARRLTEAPHIVDLTGFGGFLQALKNQGMQLRLAGHFPTEADQRPNAPALSRPYVVVK